MTSKARAQELAALINQAVGADVVRTATDKSLRVEYISTGILPIDILFGGGVPTGRFVEVYGDYSTLKSYLGLKTIREVQRLGKVAAVIDTERTFDPDWAKEQGVDIDSLLVWPPRDDDQIHTGEEAIDVAQAMVRGGVGFILFDSVAAAFPQQEASKRLSGENIQPARLAMLMSAAMRRLTASNSTTSIMWINQLRVNIGITFGSNEALPGGKALGYYASMRLSLRKTGKLTRDEKAYTGEKWENAKVQIGQKYKAELTKSKLNKPFRDVHFTWDLTSASIDHVGFLITQGVEIGAITIKGNTWQCGSVKGVGKDKFRQAVFASPAIQKTLEAKIREHHGLPASTSDGGPAAVSKKVLVRRRS